MAIGGFKRFDTIGVGIRPNHAIFFFQHFITKYVGMQRGAARAPMGKEIFHVQDVICIPQFDTIRNTLKWPIVI